MSYTKMLSIDGLEYAILGTGHRGEGPEVLVYDGYKVEEICSLKEYREELEGAGLLHMAPIFVYLDDTVRDEIGRSRKQERTIH
jgi:hypothetical protein